MRIGNLEFGYRKQAAPTAPESTPKVPEPKSYASRAGGKGPSYFQRRNREKMLDKYDIIRRQGGIVTEAIGLYPLAMLSHGWKLVDESDGREAQAVYDHLDKYGIDIDNIVEHLVSEAAYFQTGVAERLVAGGRLVGVKLADSRTFYPVLDAKGHIIKYVQKGQGFIEGGTSFNPEDLVVWNWGAVLDGYGTGLVAPAFDDIKRDTTIAEACANAIQRHGFPKYHITVGPKGQPPLSQVIVNAVGSNFETLNEKNEFATCADVEIKPIDSGGVDKVEAYNDFSVQRICTALGVPEEVIGLGRGSTEATAIVKTQHFYDKIRAKQTSMALAIDTQVIDAITRKRGSVWLHFNDPNPESANARVDRVVKLVAAVALDPEFLVTQDEAREMLGMGAKSKFQGV